MARTWQEVHDRWKQFRDMRPRKAPAAEAVRWALIGWLRPVIAREEGDPDEAWAECDAAASAMHKGDAAKWETPAPTVYYTTPEAQAAANAAYRATVDDEPGDTGSPTVDSPPSKAPKPAKRTRKPRKKATKKTS